ncbi:FAD:protein FMN transferase [Aureimonas populi]|uniref:FAD:protein FMN transferase n=1 Tax=Aureimonas populi TaxID=1701758 RepID=A0ABW5CME1_9HYPH|nr:FAD:protein FMN transferase [Aureimonas populi]
MVTRRQFLAGAGAALAMAALPAMAAEPRLLSGRAFGTRWRVTLPRGADDALAGELSALLAEVDASMSPFRADSEITRFNRSGATGWRQASPGMCDVAGAALDIARLTGGAFDPSVGPAVHRFGFGPVQGAMTGSYRGIEAGEAALSKSEAGLSLDLCGIAKGHAVDRLAAHLAARGHGDFLVDIGGDMRAAGRGPHGRAWRLGIEDPLAGGARRKVELAGEALATSGDAIHAYELNGRRYSHTIDPATGEPVLNAVASVSVIAPDAMRADALATALMVMGPQKGLAFADANAIPAFFLLREEGGLREAANGLFLARLIA